MLLFLYHKNHAIAAWFKRGFAIKKTFYYPNVAGMRRLGNSPIKIPSRRGVRIACAALANRYGRSDNLDFSHSERAWQCTETPDHPAAKAQSIAAI